MQGRKEGRKEKGRKGICIDDDDDNDGGKWDLFWTCNAAQRSNLILFLYSGQVQNQSKYPRMYLRPAVYGQAL